ncbi:MAG: hypothetical protein M0Z89_09165 [Nitrospiraceae bacterium]|nr:hypothetical protein [Nitrospiraceae bacterium]
MHLSSTGSWFLGIGLVVLVFAANAKALPLAASAGTTTAHRGDPELQQKRRSLMQGALALGIISKIEDNGLVTRVLVGRQFLALSMDGKEQILNVVWAYYKTEDPQKNVVLVIDRKSGKKLGEYSPANHGLKMEESTP